MHGPLHWLGMMRAWKWIYGELPLRVILTIIVHDWGYIITGIEPDANGSNSHPALGAKIASLWGHGYLAAGHSRRYAKKISKLCFIDKIWHQFVSPRALRIAYFFDIGLQDSLEKILKESAQCAEKGEC